MGKIISIWGSPNSGKTTLSIKLAQYIYEKYKAVVIVLFCDEMTPMLPVILPNTKSDQLFSVGEPLSKVDATESEILKNIVTFKGKNNLGFIGYKDGENKYSYASFSNTKAFNLLATLKMIADFVIVDCTSNMINNILSTVAIEQSDNIIRTSTPDLKCISFFSSQLPLYSDPKYKLEKHLFLLNNIENEFYMPINEAKSHFNCELILPYSKEVKQQLMNGELIKRLHDKKYNAIIKSLAEKVV